MAHIMLHEFVYFFFYKLTKLMFSRKFKFKFVVCLLSSPDIKYIFSWPKEVSSMDSNMTHTHTHTHSVTHGAEILNFEAITLKIET